MSSLTQGFFIKVGQSQTLNKHHQHLKNKLLHQRALFSEKQNNIWINICINTIFIRYRFLTFTQDGIEYISTEMLRGCT